MFPYKGKTTVPEERKVKGYIEAAGNVYPVRVRFVRKGRCTASVRKTGVTISIPVSAGSNRGWKLYGEMLEWAKKTIEESPGRFSPEPVKEYHDGQMLKVGSEEYELEIRDAAGGRSTGKMEGNRIMIRLANAAPEIRRKHASTIISRLVAGKRLPGLYEKILELNGKHFNVRVGRISFRNNRSRWGSCSKGGNISISTRLLFAPDEVIEYVCIHELAHIVEHNHSERFWALVEKADPGYRDKIRWLKENGSDCRF